jgi:hypothetical protein
VFALIAKPPAASLPPKRISCAGLASASVSWATKFDTAGLSVVSIAISAVNVASSCEKARLPSLPVKI